MAEDTQWSTYNESKIHQWDILALKRVEMNYFDSETYAFHERVHTLYMEHYRSHGSGGVCIDANRSKMEVFEDIVSSLDL